MLSQRAEAYPKILVVVANYGTGNDAYLSQVIQEYRSMSFAIDIVVCSNIRKDIPGIELVVGLPTSNPRSLPFAHKAIFAERLNQYDLFLYTEDDILITEKNLRAFLQVSTAVPDDELLGFLRIEKDRDGRVFFADMHNRFHWDPASVRTREQYTFAFFSNEHAACYLLTRAQLKRAIDSGGFLLEPRQGEYEMLETAATDPYTQCGFRKMICISHIDQLTVHHLPNKYIGKMGLEEREVYRQIEALKAIDRDQDVPTPLFRTESKLQRVPFSVYYSKNYYEPAREDILSLVPEGARTVLSLGCGWGAAEAWLANKGMQVVAVPLDRVISTCAEAKGLQVVHGDFKSAKQKLVGRRFDCLLISNVLHLVSNPADLLASFEDLLTDGATVIVVVPNRLRLAAMWKSVRAGQRLRELASFEKTGVHFTSHRTIRKWLNSAGLKLQAIKNIVRGRSQRFRAAGLMSPLLAAELVALAKKN